MKIELIISILLVLLGTIRGHLLRTKNINSIDELRSLTCPEGATFRLCGKECDNSCHKKFNNNVFVFGCFCAEGMIMVDEKCVPKGEYCATRIRAAKEESWKELGTLCDNPCAGEDCDITTTTELATTTDEGFDYSTTTVQD